MTEILPRRCFPPRGAYGYVSPMTQTSPAATTVRSSAARAAAVSRTLRTAGMRPLPSGTARTREGMRVTSSVLGQVNVSVDIDAPGRRRRIAQDAMEVLAAAGYAVGPLAWEDGWEGWAFFSVTRAAA